MDKNEIARHANELDALSHEEDGVEYWLARDIMEHMGYSKWENFAKAVQRAKDACANSGQQVEAHFRDTTRNAATVNGGTRVIGDVKLTRYACYLVAQNGDPRKEEVALLQSYFAVQTRTAELLEQRMGEISRLAGREALAVEEKQLSKLSYERGVDERGFGIIRSHGDQALFGRSTQAMKDRLGVPKNRPLADRLHPINVTAKQLATQMTNLNIEQKDLHGTSQIGNEHVGNNRSVRNALVEQGIVPEDLPAQEDIRKIERRVRKDERRVEGAGFKAVESEMPDD